MNGREVRAKMNHPVIDSDAHYMEFGPMVKERLRKIGGDKIADAFDGFQQSIEKPLRMTPEERMHKRVTHGGFWQAPMEAYDRASAMIPKLFYDRLDEIGLDFCIMYPTGGAVFLFSEDREIRIEGCKSFNRFAAEYYGPYADRLTPVAVIPSHTPDEAIEVLEHAVGQLGMKAAVVNAVISRQAPAALEGDEEVRAAGPWYDVLALDSIYDYDPVWQKCLELGISPTFHSAARNWGLRRSPNNYVYNHVGHFAAASHAIAKAFFLGGVTRRFPELRIAFLESGTAWAAQLYADLIEHWEKRNAESIQHLSPDNLDHEKLMELARKHGPPDMVELMTDREAALFGSQNAFASSATGGLENLDDYHRCEIKSKADFKELFVDKFYFGCEADDRLNGVAFIESINRGSKLNALYSSDVGHWDVPDMNEVVTSAYELIEKGVMNADDFRRFTFENPAHFWTSANPDFFKGTIIEKQVDELLAAANHE